MSTALPTAWRERHADFANLFNPAFGGLVLRAACQGFASQSRNCESGMPFPLAFIAVPMIVNPEIRARRPNRIQQRLAKWFADRPAIKAAFPSTARALAPIVRESIITMMRAGLLAGEHSQLYSIGALNEPGVLPPNELGVLPPNMVLEDTIAGHLAHAHFVGRWLAATGSVRAVFEATGTKP